MKNLLVKVATGLLGIVVTLAWWTIRGDSSGSTTLSKIPGEVWGGGSTTVEVTIEANCETRFSMYFSERGEQPEPRSMNAWEMRPPGSHTWTVKMPANVGGSVEVGCENPQKGNKLSWKIRSNGNIINEQSEEQTEDIKPGYGFFLQIFFADFTTGELSEDD